MQLSKAKAALVVLVFSTLAAPAWAIYKCKDPATGKTTYSDVPCPADASGGRTNIRPNVLEVHRKQALDLDASEDSKTPPRDYGLQSAGVPPPAFKVSTDAHPSTTYGCHAAKSNYISEAGARQPNNAALAEKGREMSEKCTFRKKDEFPPPHDPQLCESAKSELAVEKSAMTKNNGRLSAIGSWVSAACGRSDRRPSAGTSSTTGGGAPQNASAIPTNPPANRVIVACDPGGCNDNFGRRYPHAGGPTFVNPAGGTCTRVGNTFQCP